MDLKQVTKA